MNVLELLQGQMSDQVVETLMNQVGTQDKQQTAAAANGVMATLMGALARNASTPEGRNSLSQALDNDHDGSVLDNLTDVFSGQANNVSQRATNGSGILNHILGGKQDSASSLISGMSGIDKNAAMSMMVQMAPMVMGALGRQKREASLDADGIAGLLSNTVQSSAQSRAEMSIVEKFLDQDGDGSVMDDLMRMGSGVLGSFFKK